MARARTPDREEEVLATLAAALLLAVLLFSQTLTLYVTPVFYVLLDRLRGKR